MNVNKMIAGYQHFRKNFFKVYEEELFKSLKNGQNPNALFICCSDSRIVPALILNVKPGDIFYIRNVGNIVPVYDPNGTNIEAPAAIEYAVNVLKVEHIIVCGHSNCGACASLYKDIDDPNLAHVVRWLALNEKVKKLSLMSHKDQPVNDDLYSLTEHVSILCQLENLLTYPFIKELTQQNKLLLHGWHYNVSSGELEYYDSETREFKPLEHLQQ